MMGSFLFLIPFFFAPPVLALVFGIIAKVKGNKSPTAAQGFVLSIIGCALMLLGLILALCLDNM